MAVKTFATGEVLTASDTNTYLNNGGLVYIASGSLSSNATLIQTCFTTTYTSYRILLTGVGVTANSAVGMKMAQGLTVPAQGWQVAYLGVTSAGGAAGYNTTSSTYAETGIYIGAANTPIASLVMDIQSPQVAQRTMCSVSVFSYDGANFFTRVGGAVCDNSNQYDGIQFYALNAGASLTGTYTVMGYRKP